MSDQKCKTRLKICHATSVHPLNHLRVLHKFARSQADYGHEVHLVGFQDTDYRQGVHYFDQIRIESLEDGHIKNRLRRATIGAFTVIKKAINLQPDLIVIHDPELIIFALWARILGIRVIFDAHEDHLSQNKYKMWVKGWKKPLLLGYTWFLQKCAGLTCWRITAVTQGVADRFPVHKTDIIRNFPLKNTAYLGPPVNRQSYKNRALYMGRITPIRGGETMVKAAALSSRLDQLDLAGNFESISYQEKLEQLSGWDKTVYHGQLNQSELQQLLGDVKIGLAILEPTPNHLISIPLKLLEYYAQGLPVIASNFPCWQEFVTHNQSGYLISPNDPQELADTLDKIFDDETYTHLSAQVKNEYMHQYEWEQEMMPWLRKIDLIW